MKYQLIVDSCCELTQELKDEHGVISVPLKITIDGKEYIDDENIDMEEFLNALAAVKELPKSACPSPGEYAETFTANDADWVFVVTRSSKLSGSYNSAVQAAEIVAEEGKKVHVFDSKSASAAQLLIAMKLIELIQSGLSAEDIIREGEKFIDSTQIYFILEKTDNLVKNGRMNSFLGKALAALNIKLVLGSDGDGNIKLVAKVRGGFDAALEKLAQTIADDHKGSSGNLVITHCKNKIGVDSLLNKLDGKAKFEKIIVLPTGALSGMYADIGGVLAAFNK